MIDIDDYLERAKEIIGPRTKSEKNYDDEVVKRLKKYGKIRKALNGANKKYPQEALKYSEENIEDLKSRYEYILEHSEIVKKLGR